MKAAVNAPQRYRHLRGHRSGVHWDAGLIACSVRNSRENKVRSGGARKYVSDLEGRQHGDIIGRPHGVQADEN